MVKRTGLSCALGILGLLLATLLSGNSASAAGSYRLNEAIVLIKSGSSAAELAQAVRADGYEVEWLGFDRVYGVRPARTRSAAPTDRTQQLLDTLRALPVVEQAEPNLIMQKFAEPTVPTDPRYSEQWALTMMQLPAAWQIQRGNKHVFIAVIDDGIDPTHPDFRYVDSTGATVSRLLPGRDLSRDTDDPTHEPVAESGHGTMVSGAPCAAVNNGIGIAGATWNDVKILPCKIADANNAIDIMAGIKALAFTLETRDRLRLQLGLPDLQAVANMSWGGPWDSDNPDPNNVLVKPFLDAANQGLVMCMAAGNSYDEGNPPIHPANIASLHSNIICVGAVGPTGRHAYYSSARPYTTIAAPGGDMSLGTTSGVLLTTKGGGYDYTQGTSFASPYAAGVCALLLAQGAKPEDVKGLLTSTATRVGPTPNPQYGWGIINAYAALSRIAATVTMVSPSEGRRYETKRVVTEFQVTNSTASDITVLVDGKAISRDLIEAGYKPVPGTNRATVTIGQVYQPGRHTVQVDLNTNNPLNPLVTASVTFTVALKQLPAGRSMISMAYFQPVAGTMVPAKAEDYLVGGAFTLYRWMPIPGSQTDGQYYVYRSDGSRQEDPASFDRTGVQITDNLAPLGLGYFLDAPNVLTVNTDGVETPNKGIAVPLSPGWNMVGNPFPFNVTWNGCEILADNGDIYDITTAASKDYILPHLYTWDNGRYIWYTAPAGALNAWGGYWVRAMKPCTLVIYPTGSARAQAGSVVETGWKLTLRPAQGMMAAVGVSSKATDGNDLLDVPAPPSVDGERGVYILDTNATQKRLQDMKSADGARKSWRVRLDGVNQLNYDLTGSSSRSLRLRVRDEATGRLYTLSNAGTLSLDNAAESRTLTIEATNGASSGLRLTNVRVNRTRGSVVSVQYTVSEPARVAVEVLDSKGTRLQTVSTTSAGRGVNSVSWNGRDAEGRALPAGMYLFRIHAEGEQGEQVQVTQPAVLTR